MVSIEHVDNGYVVSLPGSKKVFVCLENVMAELLSHFEGRSAGCSGDAYGIVYIQREQYRALPCNRVSGVEMSVSPS